MQSYAPLEKKELPDPPHWTKALGVGVVVMGLGIGTGELIMWPHLITKHGLTLLWLALVGISGQYFINREVARHEVATGEGFFTTSARVFAGTAFFWFVAAIILYVWPAWATAIGTTLVKLTGYGDYIFWARAVYVLLLLITFSGRIAYVLLERILLVTVPTFFILLLAISSMNLTWGLVAEGLRGVFSFGKIPDGVDMNVLLGAVVFAGAGGMLNLAVSLWYRDKQVGMGKYVGRITNPITGRVQAVAATGYTFDTSNPMLMRRWRGWMRYVTIDQGVIFLILGFTTLFLLSLNAYAVLVPMGIVPEGVQVAVVQANIFGEQWGSGGFYLFLVMAFLMLFSVMWTVIDALTRMLTDIIYTNARSGPYVRIFSIFDRVSAGGLYYSIVTLVCIVGIILSGYSQPLALLTISGVLSGISMAIYMPLLMFVNNRRLPEPLRPNIITNIFMFGFWMFYMYFAYVVIRNAILLII